MLLITLAIASYIVGFLAILLLRLRTEAYGWIASLCAAVSFACVTLVAVTGNLPREFTFREITFQGISARFGFIADPLSLLGAGLVSFVALLVFLYAQDYMKHDPAKRRFFAEMCLFAGSMVGILLSSSLLQMFVFWELVGLSSYLLIGFWYERPEVAKAAQRVFSLIMFGDVLLLGGIIMLGMEMGSLNFRDIVSVSVLSDNAVFGLLLVLGGALLKSAQAPFFWWLPLAMEGPTPVSALLHAATMVKAGVLLLLRLWPLLALAGFAPLVLGIAMVTITLAGLAALAERDVKRVLAYSTVSQLGFMFLAMGLGAPQAGLFHLVNDAFYKALLFAGAGVIIHAAASRDLFSLAAFDRKKHALFLALIVVGTLGIAGVPPLGAFFSKDAVLETALHKGPMFFAFTMFAALLTGLYISRWLFLVLRPAFVKSAHALPVTDSHQYHARMKPAHEENIFGWKTAAAMGTLAFGVMVSGGTSRIFFPHFFYEETPERLNLIVTLSAFALVAAAFAINFFVYFAREPNGGTLRAYARGSRHRDPSTPPTEGRGRAGLFSVTATHPRAYAQGLLATENKFSARIWWRKTQQFAQRGFGLEELAEFLVRGARFLAHALSVADRSVLDGAVHALAAFGLLAARSLKQLDKKALDGALDNAVAQIIAMCTALRSFDWTVIDGAVREIGAGFIICGRNARLLVNGELARYMAALIAGAVAFMMLARFVFY